MRDGLGDFRDCYFMGVNAHSAQQAIGSFNPLNLCLFWWRAVLRDFCGHKSLPRLIYVDLCPRQPHWSQFMLQARCTKKSAAAGGDGSWPSCGCCLLLLKCLPWLPLTTLPAWSPFSPGRCLGFSSLTSLRPVSPVLPRNPGSFLHWLHGLCYGLACVPSSLVFRPSQAGPACLLDTWWVWWEGPALSWLWTAGSPFRVLWCWQPWQVYTGSCIRLQAELLEHSIHKEWWYMISTTFTLELSYASHSKPLHEATLITRQSQGPLVTSQES